MEAAPLPAPSQHTPAIFITGATGYIGKRLINVLIKKEFRVIALVRKGSQAKVQAGVEVIIADPFDAKSFQHHIPLNSVFVQLLGVSHPSPKKAALFQEVDLSSLIQAVFAARYSNVSHFIYVSVAMEPTTIMAAYQEARKKGEEACIKSGLQCTFIRPWYVMGPGHLWPVLLLPVYALAALIPSLRKKAKAFGLVTIRQMIKTLVRSIESAPLPLKIFEIPDIRTS